MVRALRRFFAAFAFALIVLASARPASAQARVDVEKARAAYLARNYGEAEQRLRTLVDSKNGLKELSLLSQARMLLAAALLAQQKREPAGEVFEKLILEDPSFEPDPLGFPSDVLNTFFDVRAQLQEKIRQAAQASARLEAERRARAEEERRQKEAWLARVKQMAQEEKVTVKNSRLVAMLPFGAGQFQNREPVLGWTFLVSEAALVVASAVTLPMYRYALARRDEEAAGFDLDQKKLGYQERADSIYIANLSFAGAFAAIAVVGIVQANLAYVPEFVDTKKRPLPSMGKVVPLVAPLARSEAGAEISGFILGAGGVF